jgi:HTH-type transcriptional regulator / antitoxin HigA
MDMPVANIIVPHPGEFIKEELDARGWSQRDLAYILGCPEQAVNLIVSGRRGISAEMAKALGDAFNVPADFFANLQKAYELSQARQPDPGVAKRASFQSVYPVREMIKREWLQDTDAAMLETQMLRFFQVNRLDDILPVPHAAKRAKYEALSPIQLAWLLRETCLRLRQLLIDPEDIRHVPKLLIECGVRFMLVEPLPNSKIDGVCTWLDNAPVIALSSRLDKIDNFWFVLRHEIEHALCGHGKMVERIDEDLSPGDEEIPEEEKIANAAAAEFCVPAQAMNDFIARKDPFFSERDTLGFARLQQVHPGVVVGQLQWKTKRFELFRRYLVKVRHNIAGNCMIDGWGQVAPVTL